MEKNAITLRIVLVELQTSDIGKFGYVI